MTDHLHKKSGYISTFWHVLFAPFIQLFIRIFPFAKAKNPPQNQSRSQYQNQPQHQHQQSSSPSLPPPPPPTPPLPLPLTSSPSSPPPPPPPPPYNPDTSLVHPPPVPDPDPDPNPDFALVHQHDQHDQHDQHGQHDQHHHHLDFSSQHDPMAAAKKRGGQRRGGGVKANGPKSTAAAATTPAPADQSNNRPASQTKPNATSNTFTPAGVTPLANQRDTKYQPDGPKPTASRRGSRGGRNRGRSSPTRQPVDNTNANIVNDTKENSAPRNYNGFAPVPPQIAQNAHTTQSTTALKPLVPADNKTEPQKPGTRSQVATKSITATAKPTDDENAPPQDPQVEHVRTVVDRLTLDESPASEQVPEKDLTKATAAAETSALPVPLVVAIPLPGKTVPPKLTVPDAPAAPILPGLIEPKTDEERVEREYHLNYMREALDMGQLALNTNETPVGCVLVYHGRTIAKGMNATNVTRNGTRHAEFMALSALLSRREKGDVGDVNTNPNPALDDASWGDVDPRDGHIFPYGQKLHPAPVVDRSIISECILYVTVEPCVMCASLLRQLGIKKVYFGAVNDKFGGTGGVFRIHMNSKPVAKPHGRPYQNGYGPPDVDRISKGRVSFAPREDDDGDGGNVEPGFPADGGFLRDDAVSLLRRFYVQENGRAPQPRKKEGRAARLFAMENQGKTGCPNGSTSEFSDTATLPDTPVDPEPTAEDRQLLESLAKSSTATTTPDVKSE